MMANDFLGITTCDECRTRIKLREKHASLEGKTVRCPKCHSLFSCSITHPTETELAAIQNEEEEEKQERRKRRTKSEIRDEWIDTVREGLRSMHGRLSSVANAERSSEEEVRRWCVDALRAALGYSDEQIDTETRVLNKRVDIVLKKDGKVFLVIECKNIRSPLRCNVRDQAAHYALALSADWAAVTNGQVWKLYRVLPQQGVDPKLIEIFDVSLLDEDGVSDADAEMLYLLTARAVNSGDLERMYHQVAATSRRRLLRALQAERVVKALRIQLVDAYCEESGHKVNLDDDQTATLLEEAFEPLELPG